jgi:hypothetical protein
MQRQAKKGLLGMGPSSGTVVRRRGVLVVEDDSAVSVLVDEVLTTAGYAFTNARQMPRISSS